MLEVVKELRRTILSTDKTIAEHIKWNSPAFYYAAEMKAFDPKEYKRDLVVMNLHKKDVVLLIFPTGAKIKEDRGLLEGKFADGRKMIKILSLKEAKAKQAALKKIIKDWIKLIDK